MVLFQLQPQTLEVVLPLKSPQTNLADQILLEGEVFLPDRQQRQQVFRVDRAEEIEIGPHA